MPAVEVQHDTQSTLTRSAEISDQQDKEEQDLLIWTAPSRPFFKADRQFYIRSFAMAGIISLILFLAEGIMPVLLIISIVFLGYVLTTVVPENIEYKITTKGIKIAGSLTRWEEVRRFWLSTRFENRLVVFETLGIPGRLELVIKPEIESELKKEALKFVPFDEMTAGRLDKITSWVAQKLLGIK